MELVPRIHEHSQFLQFRRVFKELLRVQSLIGWEKDKSCSIAPSSQHSSKAILQHCTSSLWKSKKKIEKLWKKPRFFDWRTIRQARHSTRILGSVQLTSVWCSLVPEIDNSRFTFIRRFRKSLFQNSRISEIRIFRHFVELSVLRIEIQLSHKLKQLSQNR